MKLHRKIKHNEKVCRAHDLGSYAQGQGQGQWSKSCLSNNSKTTEANLTKLYRKIEHNEKVCHKRFLRKVKVTMVKGQIVPKIVLLINY